MKKKTLLALLTLVLSFNLFGCKDNTEVVDDNNTTTKVIEDLGDMEGVSKYLTLNVSPEVYDTLNIENKDDKTKISVKLDDPAWADAGWIASFYIKPYSEEKGGGNISINVGTLTVDDKKYSVWCDLPSDMQYDSGNEEASKIYKNAREEIFFGIKDGSIKAVDNATFEPLSENITLDK